MWLEQKRAETELSVAPISLRESQEWQNQSGSIRHRTGGFFEISGLETRSPAACLDRVQQPIIIQPEIGVLGFIVASGQREASWLMQAKPEPGNVYGVQLAPTVQATYSNYSRVHGGAITHYLDFFSSDSISYESDSLQSEQGTRFYQKVNRNAVCRVPFPIACPTDAYCWHTSGLVKGLLLEDYSINTDARSVIVTSPWSLLTTHPVPFAGFFGKAWPELETSYFHPVQPRLTKHIIQRLHGLRRAIDLKTTRIALEGLQHWQLTENAITCQTGGAFDVEFYSVDAPTREKPTWDQPFLRSTKRDQVVLFAQQKSGVVRFLLRFSFEIGLSGGVELGPSYKKESLAPSPDWIEEAIEQGFGHMRATVEQSDEGGRFMKSRCRYSIVELPKDFPTETDEISFWVTLAELESLTQIPRLLTNEARSAISLLLAFA